MSQVRRYRGVGTWTKVDGGWMLQCAPPLQIPARMRGEYCAPLPPPHGPATFPIEIEWQPLDAGPRWAAVRVVNRVLRALRLLPAVRRG